MYICLKSGEKRNRNMLLLLLWVKRRLWIRAAQFDKVISLFFSAQLFMRMLANSRFQFGSSN